MSKSAPCMWMRGGSSKGGYFLADDLPADTAERDAFLLKIMGSPDPRQIDGMGGADPLTSKIAVVSKSDKPDVDVEYLFLYVLIDEAIVTDAQNCGNMLAGVGPFAIERGLGTHLYGQHRPGSGGGYSDAERPGQLRRRCPYRRRTRHFSAGVDHL